jgi:2,3-bisphosphoglycerate-dependent phosphoglycerate mutase
MTGAGLFATSFYFLRHGESTANAAHVIAGWGEFELTERGREEARRAALLLRGLPIRSIVSSPMRRSYDTALPAAEILGVPIEVADGLQERNWGVMEGRSMAERPEELAPPPEGAESWEEFRDRVMAALAALTVPVPALVVGHAGTMRVLRCALCRDPGWRERYANGVPVRFDPPGDPDAPWSWRPVA